MKKKLILLTISICVISLLTYLGYNIFTTSKQKNKSSKQIQNIPNFKLTALDSIPFSKKELKPNTNTIFIYFNSECDFCHHEAKNIKENLGKFKNVQFVFVSTESINSIKKFAIQYELHLKPNIIFLHDNSFTFYKQFDAKTIPYVLIYDKNQKLTKKHKGQLNASGILKALKQ